MRGRKVTPVIGVIATEATREVAGVYEAIQIKQETCKEGSGRHSHKSGLVQISEEGSRTQEPLVQPDQQ